MPPITAADRRAAEAQALERRRRARQAAWLLAGSIWLAVAVWAVVGTGGLVDLRRLEREAERLDEALRQAEEANRLRERILAAIESDPLAIERLARETLDYQAPDEIVYLLSEP